MKELSLHILDIVENSIRAEATMIEISVMESRSSDELRITITDNGKGMDAETVKRALDPFFSTKTVRRIGIGLPLFRQAAENAGGSMTVISEPGKGTEVSATFQLSHIDRQPLGDMGSTIAAILMENPSADIVYQHTIDGDTYIFDTRPLRATLQDVPLSEPEVIRFITEMIRERQTLDEAE